MQRKTTEINFAGSIFPYYRPSPTNPRNYVPTNLQKIDKPRKLAPMNLNDSTVYGVKYKTVSLTLSSYLTCNYVDAIIYYSPWCHDVYWNMVLYSFCMNRNNFYVCLKLYNFSSTDKKISHWINSCSYKCTFSIICSIIKNNTILRLLLRMCKSIDEFLVLFVWKSTKNPHCFSLSPQNPQ